MAPNLCFSRGLVVVPKGMLTKVVQIFSEADTRTKIKVSKRPGEGKQLQRVMGRGVRGRQTFPSMTVFLSVG